MTTFKPLRELVVFRGGGTPSKQVPEYWNGNIPWASVKDFTSTTLSETQDFISQEGLRNSSANLIPKGHVIIPTRMSLGKAAINTVDLAINQDLRALVPIVPMDTQFLLHAVLSLKDEIAKKGSGATVKGITQDELYKLEIAFPPLEDQIRIAHLLGKVEGLIAQRKQHLQQLDDLLKSVFLEMFGDPARNEKGWEPHPFSKLFSTPPRIGTTKPVSNDGTIPVIRVGELGEAQVNFGKCKKVNLDKMEMDKYRVYKGDILLARAIASQDLLGKASLITHLEQATAFDSHVMRIRFRSEIIAPAFAYQWLKSDGGRNLFLKASNRTSVQYNINSKQISSIAMPLPPIGIQNQFAVLVEKIEDIKFRYQQSLSDLETLYGALSLQAFKGELDLSCVPMPAIQAEEEKTVAAESIHAPTEQDLDILLPDTENLLAAAEGAKAREALISQWLEAYHSQLGRRPFLVQHFMAAAQTRLAELHPDNDFELGANDYEHIKTWVFAALAVGTLTQAFDDEGNRIELKTVQP